MLNDPLSHGLWEQSAPAAPATLPLSGARKADVAIIGAGYTGLSAALHLAEHGRSAVVLEAGEIGFGGSGRNVGLVNAGMWVQPDALIATLGETYGNRLLTLLGDGPRRVFELIQRFDIACEAVPTGTLHCAVGAKGFAELQERAAQWQQRGAPVELLDDATAARMIGTDAYTGALLDRRAGTVQPLAYARGLARAALAAGAQIHTASRVQRVESLPSGWRLTTATGTLEAEWVIVATNAYTDSPWPEIRTELVHLPYFNFATPPLPAEIAAKILPERQGAWDTEAVLTSFRFDQQNRLVFGSVGALRGTGQPVHRAWAERAMAKLFPALRGIGFDSGWYGMIGMTRDNLPRFHRLADKVIAFCGYNGRGISPGTVLGAELAQLAAGEIGEGDLPLPVTTPENAAFRGAREAAYEYGSQASHLIAARL